MTNSLKNLIFGATVLGSGGGGTVDFFPTILEKHLGSEEFKPYNLQDIEDHDPVIAIGLMGNPVLQTELLDSSVIFTKLHEKIKKVHNIEKFYITSVFAAARNLFFLSIFSLLENIPLLDADLTGRTFPELDMNTMNLHNLSIKSVIFSNTYGEILELYCDNFKKIEGFGRQIIGPSGGYCLFAFQPISGKIAKKTLIDGALTRVQKIGKLINKRNLPGFLQYSGGQILGCGIVTDMNLNFTHKYIRSVITIENPQKKVAIKVLAENEYLAVSKDGQLLALPPDIIILFDFSSFAPLSLDTIQQGQSVIVCKIDAPSQWYSEKGLSIVGSNCYNLENF